MADVFEDEAEQTVTIQEFIKSIEDEELEADLVLGGDEGKDCTYSKGYMKRQAVFSCLTCVPAGNAGVCTACSICCHDGHEVVELWTKRNFRCDCGNSKFGAFVCKLCPSKDPENSDNSYNKNFKGSYCTCDRPYPDPNAEEQVEMIQCCICEDWFHENHLGLDPPEEIPRDEEGEPLYEDFICQECARTFSFLRLYPASIWATLRQKNPLISTKEENMLEHSSSIEIHLETENGVLVPNCTVESSSTNAEYKIVSTEDALCGRNKASSSNTEKGCNIALIPKCILGIDINLELLNSEEKKPMFLAKKWRDLLCRCQTCDEFYTQKGIDYLIDHGDSIEEYEKMAKQRREENLQKQEGAELNFLNKLNHVQKIEILSGIADIKKEFQSFLESFDGSKAVTSADIQGVFENLAKKKKQRLL